MEIDSNQIHKQGWLHKRGEHIKTWRSRYFILKLNGFFLGYNTKPSKTDEPNNTFYIRECNILITNKPKVNTFILKIFNGDKIIERFFAAYRKEERDEWIEAINYVSKSLMGNLIIENIKCTRNKLSLDDFEYLRIIGRGHYGKVILTREKTTQKLLAMKILKKNLIIDQNKVNHTTAENHVLRFLKNPFIINLIYSFQTRDLLCLAMEYICGGDLFFHLNREGKFSEDKSRFYCAEICYAIGYLHENDIIYRDLKLENVLLDSNGHVKLGDFGLCKMNMKSDSKTDTFCGTIEYLAPEIIAKEFNGDGYTRTVDWWATGVVLYEMLTGKLPFSCKTNNIQNQKGLFDKILNETIHLPTDLHNQTKSILNKFLEKDPSKRIGSRNDFEDIKIHEYFSKINWDKLIRKEIDPPFKPNLKNESDTSFFDKEFTSESVRLTPPEDSFLKKELYFDSFSYYGSKTSLLSHLSKTCSIKSKDRFDLELINEDQNPNNKPKETPNSN
ncbi:unnamed protein product, partial [Brachionus calyciflorus]